AHVLVWRAPRARPPADHRAAAPAPRARRPGGRRATAGVLPSGRRLVASLYEGEDPPPGRADHVLRAVARTGPGDVPPVVRGRPPAHPGGDPGAGRGRVAQPEDAVGLSGEAASTWTFPPDWPHGSGSDSSRPGSRPRGFGSGSARWPPPPSTARRSCRRSAPRQTATRSPR